MTRVPLSKIGSFVIDRDGFLHLANRPLSLDIQGFENEEIPTHIPRNYTYSTVDSYVSDILRMHGSRLRHQPNAINDTGLHLSNICLDSHAVNIPVFFFSQNFGVALSFLRLLISTKAISLLTKTSVSLSCWTLNGHTLDQSRCFEHRPGSRIRPWTR